MNHVFLTQAELTWCMKHKFSIGVDVDTELVQLTHLVEITGQQPGVVSEEKYLVYEPTCRATTMWFHHKIDEHTEVISCDRCTTLMKLRMYMGWEPLTIWNIEE